MTDRPLMTAPHSGVDWKHPPLWRPKSIPGNWVILCRDYTPTETEFVEQIKLRSRFGVWLLG